MRWRNVRLSPSEHRSSTRRRRLNARCFAPPVGHASRERCCPAGLSEARAVDDERDPRVPERRWSWLNRLNDLRWPGNSHLDFPDVSDAMSAEEEAPPGPYRCCRSRAVGRWRKTGTRHTRRNEGGARRRPTAVGRTCVIFTEFRDSLAAPRERLTSIRHCGVPRRLRRLNNSRSFRKFLSGGAPLLLATDASQGLNFSPPPLGHQSELLESRWIEQRAGADRIAGAASISPVGGEPRCRVLTSCSPAGRYRRRRSAKTSCTRRPLTNAPYTRMH